FRYGTMLPIWMATLAILSTSAHAETPLTAAFSYQGQLKSNGAPASGTFNMTFALFDALTAGNQVGPTLICDGSAGNQPPVTVTNGLFTISLNFGSSPFAGNARWLAITVSGSPLTPRQPL